jgi:alanine racemase
MSINEQHTTMNLLCNWCHGSWLQHASDGPVGDIITDSRKVNGPGNALFVALKTKVRDGHTFIADAYEKGVRNFLVSQEMDVHAYGAANFILVKDTLQALQQIAEVYRKRFDIPVIGITGSNGKTIIKEWLYQLLSPDHNMVRSPKSYNSQIGVPMSVWLLEPQHEVAVFEAGISQPGEMERLERMIKPTIGIFTNVGEAHDEGFLNKRQKINEKLLLFRHAKQLVYCKDYHELNECVSQYLHQSRAYGNELSLQLFSWSHRMESDLRILQVQSENGKTNIEAVYKEETVSIMIPFTDPASVENAIHCWCVMLVMGTGMEKIKERMLQLHAVSMRLELKHGINGCTVINDTYNSDLTSLRIALDFLDQQQQHIQHTVILSDIQQGMATDVDLYVEVTELLQQHNIKRFIGIGPALYKNKTVFRNNKKLRSVFFKSTEDFLKKFHLITFEHEAILLKGAREFSFEKISILLEQEIHQSVLTVDLSALSHNVDVFRSYLEPGVKTMAIVKAYSYGHGSYEIANQLQYSGVDYLAVAYTDEGVALRKMGITMPIMVMSPDMGSFDRMIAWKLEPEIYNMRSYKAFTAIAEMLNVKDYPVHIKLDTGMHRLGFMQSEVSALKKQLAANPHIKIATIFSHLAASEDGQHDEYTRAQAELFREMSDEIVAEFPYKPLRHICNSAGIVRHKALHFEMVRLGIGLYGVDSSNAMQGQLKQIGTLKTIIAQIKTLHEGQTVGYSRRGQIKGDMRIATICIGYADGYPRSLGNGKAHVLIHGKAAKVMGVVAMDMCMVDVTDIPEAKEGDEAIVFSPELPLEQLAEWTGTISYEIMTGISQRVKRVYTQDQ